jgi:hypothetical protein
LRLPRIQQSDQALPESRQTNSRIRLRDAKDIAHLPRRKTFQIERRELALDRLQALHGMRIPEDGDQRSELMSITIPK